MERRKIESPHQGMCFLQPQQVFPRGREKSKKSEDFDADFQFFNVLTHLIKIVEKPLKKMPDLPDFFSRVCPHSVSKVMERRKVENPHQGMCFLQPQQVFPRGREKSKIEDRDADFQFFVLRTDLIKIADNPLKKMPDLPDFFSRVWPHSISKAMERRKIENRTKECGFCNPNKFFPVAEENRKKVKILMRIFNFSLSLQI